MAETIETLRSTSEQRFAAQDQPNTPYTVPQRQVQWRRGWRALRAVIADPDRTDKVIEFLNCTGGRADLRGFARFRAHADGQRLLAEKPSLLATLSDLDTLAALPPGSLGHTYAAFMRGGRLKPDGIVAEFRNAETTAPITDPDLQWFFERLDTMHDLWHVLTGYGRDEAGEAANLAFTLGQFPTRGVALLTLASAVVGPKDLSLSWQRYLLRAWRRGRRAVWLPMVRYEELLALALEEVRQRLRIEPPEVAHPEGVIVASRVFSSV